METACLTLPRPATATQRRAGLTVLVPAYNEEESIADTIRSLCGQTVPVDEILVIDDCSTDHTGDVARALGATVLRPRVNTGSKAGAQTYALAHVRTPYVMAIDADTVLDPHAVERILPAIREPGVAAACGFVLPRRVRTLWERGRYIEYLFAFTFYKPIQDHYARPLISSGCFSIYRTDVVRACGGWRSRTMAEDMDLTWTLYQRGHGVRFVPGAVSYPLEPHNYHFLSKQLRRWSHGFVQNVRLHWRPISRSPSCGRWWPWGSGTRRWRRSPSSW
jgi:biofilm PGA synthesis N-glycosyltransferase PgaC